MPPKGKAVHLLHVHRDQLWTMGTQQDLPSDWAQDAGVHSAQDDYETSDDDLEADAEKNSDHDSTRSDGSELKTTANRSLAENVEQDMALQDDGNPTAGEQAEPTETSSSTPATLLSSEEVDLLLHEALLQVLKHKITEGNAKELLPMNASTLYSSYVLPNRARGRAAEADIKKSSWKKLAKWLKAVEKQDVIKCKEIKGELFLLSVNWSHPQ